MGSKEVPFRDVPAFAKQGRERYGIDGATRDMFDGCLAENRSVPAKRTSLSSRAARTYLDVCFFHPFADGNARAALLALVFVLAREGVVLDHLGPLSALARRADCADSASELVRLLEILIRHTAGRAASHCSSPTRAGAAGSSGR
ncbi:hypothetical protein GCM10020367_53100 [Streptomyces sannanensis]|uniref:Fido domain-containing protein n=1 Tax=Streptomyces sannanensis TaxID=285536 RepID=A0ABP6SIU1_9ACTN